MALDGRHAVVLTSDGEFCRIATQSNVQVGAEIRWTPLQHASWQRAKRPVAWLGRGRLAAVGGMVAAMALAAVGWRQLSVQTQTHQAYGYVALDISPGVRFTVNRSLQVIAAQGTDASGRKLLRSIDVRDTSLHTAIAEIVDKALVSTHIPANDNILIATAPATTNDMSKVSDLQNAAESDVLSVLNDANHSHPHVYAFAVSYPVWHASVQLKVSPAQVAAYLAEVNSGHLVQLNQLHVVRLSSGLASPIQESSEKVNMNDSSQIKALIRAAIRQGNRVRSGASRSGPATQMNGSVTAQQSQTNLPTGSGLTLPLQMAALDLPGQLGTSAGV